MDYSFCIDFVVTKKEKKKKLNSLIYSEVKIILNYIF